MKYRHLGKAGIQVSELSLGSWVTFHHQAAIDQAVEIMAAAYDAGVNFFDPGTDDIEPETARDLTILQSLRDAGFPALLENGQLAAYALDGANH